MSFARGQHGRRVWWLNVRTPHVSKTAQPGGYTPEQMVKNLLRELAHEAKSLKSRSIAFALLSASSCQLIFSLQSLAVPVSPCHCAEDGGLSLVSERGIFRSPVPRSFNAR